MTSITCCRERLAAVERDQERLERERTETETVITEEKRSRTTIRQALHTHASYLLLSSFRQKIANSVVFDRNVTSYRYCVRVHVQCVCQGHPLKKMRVDITCLWIDKNSLDDLIQGSGGYNEISSILADQ